MRRLALAFFIMAANTAVAQTSVAFGGLKTDPTLPVEITSQSLSVNQADGTAIFIGNVLVVQGEMRLSAAEMHVEYKADKTGVERLIATGQVLLLNAADSAAADRAVYIIDAGEVKMSGNVILTQGQITLSAQELAMDIKTGLGQLSGGVQTNFAPKSE